VPEQVVAALARVLRVDRQVGRTRGVDAEHGGDLLPPLGHHHGHVGAGLDAKLAQAPA
jgi:hypothetical protein